MVRTGTLHLPAAAILSAAPEVAAAYHQAYLNTHVQAFLENIANAADDLKVKTGALVAAQGLAADLQQNAFIYRFCHEKDLLFDRRF